MTWIRCLSVCSPLPVLEQSLASVIYLWVSPISWWSLPSQHCVLFYAYGKRLALNLLSPYQRHLVARATCYYWLLRLVVPVLEYNGLIPTYELLSFR